MNQIDKTELLSNISSIRREAEALLGDADGPGGGARLRRILMILSYMREHLEMVAMARKDERKGNAPATPTSPSVEKPREGSDLS